MSKELQKFVKDINYIKEDTKLGTRLSWFAEDWDSNDFRSFIYSLEDKLDKGSIIYDKRNFLTKLSSTDYSQLKKDIVVKKFKLTREYDRLRFRFINSKAVRSLRIALALQKLGIGTPKPVAVFEERDRLRKILYSYFICEYIPHRYSLLDIIKDDNHSRREEVAQRLLPRIAEDVREMHEAGIVHNDLHGGNILIEDIDDQPQFYYIDLNRGRVNSNLNKKARIKDLARFELNDYEEEVFMKHYVSQEYGGWLKLMREEKEKRRKFRNFKNKIKCFF